MEHQIRFPHLGIVLKNVGDGINIGGFEIKYYGMIIATGFLLGLIVSYYAAKHENKFDPELVFDYLITMIIPAIVRNTPASQRIWNNRVMRSVI